jgi:hypothetical protein
LPIVAGTTGTLSVARGGTGLTSYTAGSVVHSEDGTSLTSGIKFGTAPQDIVLNQFLSGMAYQDPNNVTIGGGSATLTSLTATTVTGTSMVYNGTELNARLNPLAQAVSVQMTASTTVGGIQQLDNDNLDMGTNDFTLEFDEVIPTTRPAAAIVLDRKHDGTNGYILSVLTTGIVRLQINATNRDSTVALASATNVDPKLMIVVVRETATVAGSVTFYSNGVIVGTAISITAGTPTTVNNASARIINGTTTTRTAGSLQASRLFNRALTAAEVLDLSINGVALADRGGPSQLVTIQNSTFDSGATGWTSATVVDGELVISISGNQESGTDTGTIPANTRVIVRAVVRSTGGLVIPQFRLTTGGFNDNAQGLLNPAPATYAAGSVIEFTATNAGIARSRLWIREQSGVSGRTVFVDQVQIRNIGLTSELLASNAQSDTGQIFDTSGNKNHALLPASGATVVGRPVSQTREVRWTNTWAGTNELQYIGGVNQAILPANAYIESIIGTVSGATPHDIIVGDGSDTDRYVTITTGLAAGTTSFTLANRTTDGTNLKLTVDPDTDATMSIAWVISYRILE